MPCPAWRNHTRQCSFELCYKHIATKFHLATCNTNVTIALWGNHCGSPPTSHLHHVSTFCYYNTFALQWIIICGNMKILWAARRRSPTCADRGFCIKSVFLIEYLISWLRFRKLCQSCRCANKNPVLPRCDNHACAERNQYRLPILRRTRIAHIQKIMLSEIPT